MSDKVDRLPERLTTQEDWDVWDEYLIGQSQDKLVDFIMSRMSADERFMKMAYGFFSSDEHIDSAESLITAYISEVDFECENFNPDTDYIWSLTERFLGLAEDISSLFGRVQIYVSVIFRLDKAVAEDNVGKLNDDEDIILEELETVFSKLMNAIDNQFSYISDKEKQTILAYIDEKQYEYTLVFFDRDVIGSIRERLK